jgi:hypothetical protein
MECARGRERRMEAVVLMLSWAIPIVIVAYLFRVAQTIVLGMRSMNSHLERIAAAVDELVQAERRRAP